MTVHANESLTGWVADVAADPRGRCSASAEPFECSRPNSAPQSMMRCADISPSERTRGESIVPRSRTRWNCRKGESSRPPCAVAGLRPIIPKRRRSDHDRSRAEQPLDLPRRLRLGVHVRARVPIGPVERPERCCVFEPHLSPRVDRPCRSHSLRATARATRGCSPCSRERRSRLEPRPDTCWAHDSSQNCPTNSITLLRVGSGIGTSPGSIGSDGSLLPRGTPKPKSARCRRRDGDHARRPTRSPFRFGRFRAYVLPRKQVWGEPGITRTA